MAHIGNNSATTHREPSRAWTEASTVTENTDAPDDEVEEVAQAGIRGMISALKAEKFSPDLMINAALHIVAAWVASSQTKSFASERTDDIEALVDMLPSAIDYHRAAVWLPDPHRDDH
jgi:hypothetical protein